MKIDVKYNIDFKRLQKEFEQTSAQLGQIETQIVAINQQKNKLVSKLEGIYNEEASLSDKFKEKYGEGNINLQSGVFTPTK